MSENEQAPPYPEGGAGIFDIDPDQTGVSQALSRCWVCGDLAACQGVVLLGFGPLVRPWWVGRQRR